MPYQCCVYGCSSNSATNKNLTFHAFPSGERGLEWRLRIRNSKSDAKHSKICSRHFKEEDYHTNVEAPLKHFLKKHAMPSQHLPRRSNILKKPIVLLLDQPSSSYQRFDTGEPDYPVDGILINSSTKEIIGRTNVKSSEPPTKKPKFFNEAKIKQKIHSILYKWEEKDDFKLVELVQENQNLYDNTQSDYNDLVKVASTWKMIGKTMGKPADICQNRFANLYNQFCGALKYKSYSHINSDNFYLTKLLKKMMFLWDYLYEDLDSSDSESKNTSVEANQNETVSSLPCNNSQSSVTPSLKENNVYISKINSVANSQSEGSADPPQSEKTAVPPQAKRNVDPSQLKRNPATIHAVKIIAPIRAVRNSVFSQPEKNAVTIHAAGKGNTPMVRSSFHARRKIRRILATKSKTQFAGFHQQEESDTDSSQEVSDEDFSPEESAFRKVHLRKIIRKPFLDDLSEEENSTHFSKEKSYLDSSCKEKDKNNFQKRIAVPSKIERQAEPPKKAIILDLFQKEINVCPSQEANLADNFQDENSDSVDSPDPFPEQNSVDQSEQQKNKKKIQEKNGEDSSQEGNGLFLSEKVSFVDLSNIKHSVDHFPDSHIDCTEEGSESDHFQDLINGRNSTSTKCDSELISKAQTSDVKNSDESVMSNEVFLHLVKEYMDKIEDKEKLSDLQFRVLCLLYNNEGS